MLRTPRFETVRHLSPDISLVAAPLYLSIRFASAFDQFFFAFRCKPWTKSTMPVCHVRKPPKKPLAMTVVPVSRGGSSSVWENDPGLVTQRRV